jgi:hypothetical protein
MRQWRRSSRANSGAIRHSVYIAGTIKVWVTRSAASRAMKSGALNAGTITTVPPTCTIARRIAINPVTWLAGTASAERSPACRRMHAW